MNQRALFTIPVDEATLTTRQRQVFEAVRRAGPDGIDARQAGRLVRDASRPDTALTDAWDRAAGTEILKALRRKSLVKERRPRGLPGYWTTA